MIQGTLSWGGSLKEERISVMSITEINSSRKNQKALYRNIRNGACIKGTGGKRKDEILGITMMTDNETNFLFGVRAEYENQAEHPYIMRIVSNYAGERKNYDIDVRMVDPFEATMIEIFALCCFADDHQVSEGSAFGSFRELKNFVTLDGQTTMYRVFSYEDFLTKKINWEKVVGEIKNEFLKTGLYYQYQSCLQLMDIFDYAMLLSDEKLQEDYAESQNIIAQWKKEVNGFDDMREAASQLMKKELFH